MAILYKQTDEYKVVSEKEAYDLIEDKKNSPDFTVISYTSTQKLKKSKGEIIDEYWNVKIVKSYE